MKSISFPQGALFAFLLSGAVAIAYSLATPWYPPVFAIRLVLSVSALVYMAGLLVYSPKRQGRLSAFGIVAMLQVFVVYWVADPLVLLFFQSCAISLLRSMFHYRRMVSCFVDLLMTMGSVLAALWCLQQSQSVFLTCWCFFLIQAAIGPWITHVFSARETYQELDNAAFERAHRIAESALRRAGRLN